MSELADRVRAAFQERFGAPPRALVRAPGRVNLIGEHTDYNEGFVLPMAIDRAVVMAGSPRADRSVRLWALDLGLSFETDLDSLVRPSRSAWSDYPLGVAEVLERRGHRLHGFDVAFGGDVPQGAGLSSSAALEVATALWCDHAFGLGLPRVELARIAQQAENEFVGVQCGLMDQLASALSQAGHALLVDCRSLETRRYPLALEARGLAIAVVDSGVRRGLVDSEYNARRSQCHQAVLQLARLLECPGLASLREVTPDQLTAVEGRLDPVLAARTRHVVGENARVLAAAAALEREDFEAFGTLMDRSHQSLRDDYAVSHPAVDRLVELTRACPGVLGSRMTGAGFGGCTVTLLGHEALDRLEAEVLPSYQRATGRAPRLFRCAAAGGATVLS